jgi:hypothetical protein
MKKKIVMFVYSGDGRGDEVEKMLGKWAERLANYNNKDENSFKVEKLPKVNRSEIVKKLGSTTNIWIVSLWGHGNKYGALLDPDKKPAIHRGDARLLANREIFAIYCHSAKLMRRFMKCASKQPVSFLGFKGTFDSVLFESGVPLGNFDKPCSVAFAELIHGRGTIAAKNKFRRETRRLARQWAVRCWQGFQRGNKLSARNALTCTYAHLNNYWEIRAE